VHVRDICLLTCPARKYDVAAGLRFRRGVGRLGCIRWSARSVRVFGGFAGHRGWLPWRRERWRAPAPSGSTRSADWSRAMPPPRSPCT